MAPCSISCKFPDVDTAAPSVYASNMGPSYSVDEGAKTGEARALTQLKNTVITVLPSLHCRTLEASHFS